MFSRILNFPFVIIFSKKKSFLVKKNPVILLAFYNLFWFLNENPFRKIKAKDMEKQAWKGFWPLCDVENWIYFKILGIFVDSFVTFSGFLWILWGFFGTSLGLLRDFFGNFIGVLWQGFFLQFFVNSIWILWNFF